MIWPCQIKFHPQVSSTAFYHVHSAPATPAFLLFFEQIRHCPHHSLFAFTVPMPGICPLGLMACFLIHTFSQISLPQWNLPGQPKLQSLFSLMFCIPYFLLYHSYDTIYFFSTTKSVSHKGDAWGEGPKSNGWRWVQHRFSSVISSLSARLMNLYVGRMEEKCHRHCENCSSKHSHHQNCYWTIKSMCVLCGIESGIMAEAKSWKAMLILLTYIMHQL